MSERALVPPSLVDEAVAAIRARWKERPATAAILGSGLGAVTEQITLEAEFPYAQLPRFPRSLAPGHRGRLVCGRCGAAPVAIMDGRFHFYEGRTQSELALPLAVLRALGVKTLVVTNASGGLNPQFRSGQIMAIDDHVNFMTPGPHGREENHGPRRRPQGENYDRELLGEVEAFARRADFVLQRGVYVGVLGPNYETRAEYRFYRRLGDAVGMSTVPEVLLARALGLRVLGLSMITNLAKPDRPEKTTPEEVNRLAQLAAPHLSQLIAFVASLRS